MSIELRENGVLTVPQCVRNGVELVMQLARPWRSAFGQTRRFRDVRGIVVLPQTADISGPCRLFPFV